MPRTNGNPEIAQLALHYIHSKPRETTLRDLLADPLIAQIVPTLTLAQLGGEIPVPRGNRRPDPERDAPASAKRGRNGAANTRTADGRSAYDERVLAAIKAAPGPVSAEDLLPTTGGGGVQFRAATKRLLAARKIKRLGKARGTKYASA
jgi:hypothetical protein